MNKNKSILNSLSVVDKNRLKKLLKKNKSLVIIEQNHNSSKEIRSLDHQLKSLQREFQTLNHLHNELSVAHQNLSLTNQALLNSTSWRITYPLRLMSSQIRRALNGIVRIHRFIQAQGGLSVLLVKVFNILKNEGISGLLSKISFFFNRTEQTGSAQPEGHDRNDYNLWIEKYDTLTAEMRLAHEDLILKWDAPPLISVVMPTYNSPIEFLRQAIESVEQQIYPYWELCIADDCSTDSVVKEYLKKKTAHDSRIKVIFREQNGHISEASNSALGLATGQWCALLDHDDLLSEDALFLVAHHIIANPNVHLIYSDEDKVDELGRRFSPHFKSDWNPELFFSQNYLSHLGVYKTDLLRSIGGFRVGFEGSQDHDLALRCLPYIPKGGIHHIPKVLYHWRAISGSTALDGGAKSYADVARYKALRDYFDTIGMKVDVAPGPIPNTAKISYPIPKPEPLVSLLIPTRDKLDLIEPCVRSILEKTIYKNFEIIILDNGSQEAETLQFFERIQQKDSRVRVVRDESPFNFSAINNRGVRLSKGHLIGLINNDIEVISPGWLGEMVSLGIQEEIGCVGAKLYYSNDCIQHAGVILGIGGVAGHSHKHYPRHHNGYFSRLKLPQTLSAVTAACLLVRKDVFERVGGLDEENLKIAFNDVDFCLKVRKLGYRNVWTPYAELFHYESISRGTEDTPEKQARFAKEAQYMAHVWGEQLTQDPYYNPNLTLVSEDFSLAWGPHGHRYSNVNSNTAPPMQRHADLTT